MLCKNKISSMKHGVSWPKRRYAATLVMAGVVLLIGLRFASAEESLLKDVELCNGVKGGSPETRIKGCTNLIISRSPNSLGLAIAYNNRGNAYVAEGKYNLAIADYDNALAMNPRYAKAYNNRGVALEKQGNLNLAIANFDAAIALDSKYAHAFVNRGDVYAKKHQYKRATHDYNRALAIRQNIVGGWSGRCLVRVQNGDFPGALKDCDRAIRLKPSPFSFEARGFTHLKMQQWKQAISDYGHALNLDPKRVAALYGRGLAKLKLGDTKSGNIDIRTAKALDPTIESTFGKPTANAK